MIDAITLIDVMFAATAIIAGLASRGFATAIVTGILIGLIHAGMIALVGAQAGKFEIAELPYLKDAVEFAMQSGYLTFANARYITYLAAGAIVLLVATLIAYLVRWVLCSLVCLVMPKGTAT